MRSALLALACLGLTAAANPTCPAVAIGDRVDCYPQQFPTQSDCESRGCCYDRSAAAVGMGTPICFFPPDFGYTATDIQSTASGYTATLTRNATVTPASPYGGDISTLALSVVFETEQSVRIKVTDPAASRFEVPLKTPSPLGPIDMLYDVAIVSWPFSLKVTRKSDGMVLLDTSIGGLIYSDQFIQLSTRLASTNVYGLGEHVTPFLLDTNWQTMTLWARDQGTPTGQGNNLYGVHPIAYVREPGGNHTHAIFFLNSNAMDFILQPTPALVWRTIGGIIDLRVILDSDGRPDSVVEGYTEVMGRPFLPPYWSLGFHLCRWGYETTANMVAVRSAMAQYGIPQDTQWSDIDTMDNHLDFTVDPKAFADLPAFVDKLHQDGMHYIPIIDPGISNTQPAGQYPAYDDGTAMDVWIKDSTGQPYWMYVWPGNTTFPDFFSTNALQYWTNQLTAYHSLLPLDSAWIDMNEACNTGPAEACASNKYNNPPYVPNVDGGDLTQKTMCADAQTSVGPSYDAHSLYGYSEMVATMAAMRTIRSKRSIVISRSTFAGAGVHGGHWLGDNTATWDDLYLSIPGILNFNIFGMPLVGADIGGFNGNSNAELVTRWQQLGAFYPFSRNHNTKGAPAQDPTAFGNQTAIITRDILLIRYTLLPFLNSLFFAATINGSTVARAMWFNFPTDDAAVAIDKQFMWGDALLITPVLTQGATSVTGYFPDATWYSYYDGTTIVGPKTTSVSAPLDFIPLHVRGGSIMPTQEPAVTTTIAMTQPYGAVVALDTDGSASGTLFLDDGEALDTVSFGSYYKASLAASGGKFTLSPEHTGYNPQPTFDNLRVFGAGSVSSVKVNGVSVSTFNATATELQVFGIKAQIITTFTVSWE